MDKSLSFHKLKYPITHSTFKNNQYELKTDGFKVCQLKIMKCSARSRPFTTYQLHS